MGGRSSKEQSYRQSSSTRSTSSTSWNQQDYVQSPSYSAPGEAYAYPAYNQQPHNPPPVQNYGGRGYEPQRKQLDRKYSRIADNYNSLDEVFFSCVIACEDLVII